MGWPATNGTFNVLSGPAAMLSLDLDDKEAILHPFLPFRPRPALLSDRDLIVSSETAATLLRGRVSFDKVCDGVTRVGLRRNRPRVGVCGLATSTGGAALEQDEYRRRVNMLVYRVSALDY